MSYDSLSPIDGRYSAEAAPLAKYFSERALVDERVRVELGYLGLLVKLGVAPGPGVPRIPPSIKEVKALEAVLGHDVKAVEIFIRDRLKEKKRGDLAPYVHLGLTSEDTNSLAHASLLSSAIREVLVPSYSTLARRLARLARSEAGTSMVARTHGRPAVPTTFGKEMAVFAVRLAERVSALKKTRPMAKFSGAVGTYASFGLMGDRDWPHLLARFVAGYGADCATYSTQVVPGERLSDILHLVMNINQLMLSLSRDIWLYQTLDYVSFSRPGTVSSSTMPQKVNPVDLENAEGQTEVSNSLLGLLAYRLQSTRLQRDLSDSILRRMVGQALGHSLVAVRRHLTSLDSMSVSRKTMAADLQRHPEVFAEREQILRRLSGDELGYEKVKDSLENGRFRPSEGGSYGYSGEARRLAAESPRVVRRLLGT